MYNKIYVNKHSRQIFRTLSPINKYTINIFLIKTLFSSNPEIPGFLRISNTDIIRYYYTKF